MGQCRKDFIETLDGMELYAESLELYAEIESRYAHMAEVNGIKMAYLDFGSTDGVPLIWAHGSASTGYEILNVQAGLVDAGYRVIAIDYRGHGRTQIEITEYNTSLYHIADDIAALMDYLDISQVIIGGLSKGGFVAAAFYDAYPARVLGLLLEDGGSWSHFRLREDIQLKLVQPGPLPDFSEMISKLFDTSISYQTRLEGLKAVWSICSPEITCKSTVEYMTYLLSFLRQEDDGIWVYHCNGSLLMTGSTDDNYSINGNTLYSRLPLMQQNQELMIPLVVFRHLHVPMHIIDPVSPLDWLPVSYQNKELQALYPDLITHEVYEYDHSPHEAHLQRPERFIASAEALLEKVITHLGVR